MKCNQNDLLHVYASTKALGGEHLKRINSITNLFATIPKFHICA
jgi:hypothetical protein